MRSESLSSRVVPLPLRSMGTGFSVGEEIARARALTPVGGAAQRSISSPPDLRVDVIAFDVDGSIERPWRAGRVILQCLEGYVHVVTTDGARDLVEGEILVAEARRLRRIEARELSAVMATVVVVDQLARSCHRTLDARNQGFANS